MGMGDFWGLGLGLSLIGREGVPSGLGAGKPGAENWTNEACDCTM